MKAPSAFVQKLDELINSSTKSQKAIADELGYEKPNIITMFKQGSTRVPLERVPALAEALDFDPMVLTRMWLKEYQPGLLSVIDSALGFSMSRNEKVWISKMRAMFDNNIPAWDEVSEKYMRQVKDATVGVP